MANSRYHRLQELTVESDFLNAPVEIEKGALLLDTQTRAVLLQLKLTILTNTPKDISSVSLLIKGFDDTGSVIEGLAPKQSVFRDVYLLNEKSFGEKTPIILDPRIRRVQVEITKVTLTNGVFWVPNGELIHAEKQRSMRSLSPELAEQLNRQITQAGLTNERILFIPEECSDYWLCACGRPNKIEARSCCRCGLSQVVAFTFTEEILRRNLEDHKERERLEAERIKAENELALLRDIENNRKIKEEHDRKKAASKAQAKRFFRVFGIVGGLAAVLTVFFFAILPAIKYSQAERSLSEKNYEVALTQFGSLGDYKNSEFMLLEVKFQQASEFFTNKDYEAAARVFSEIKGYKNASALHNDIYYQQAEVLLSDKNFDEAKQLYVNLGDYQNSREMVKEVEFQKASELLNDKEYDQARMIFINLDDYKTSRELVMESDYLKAADLLTAGHFDDALIILSGISDYKNTGELVKDAKYQLALGDYQAKNYPKAIAAFLDLIGYKESDQHLSAYYELGKKYLTEKKIR